MLQEGRFLIVGVFATLLHRGIYTFIKVLLQLQTTDGRKLSAACSVGYAISLLVNYQLSLRYTVRTRGSFGKGVGFVFSHAVNYTLHIVLLNLLLWVGAGQFMAQILRAVSPGLIRAVPLLGDPTALVPIPVFIIVVPVNFLLVRFFLTRGK